MTAARRLKLELFMTERNPNVVCLNETKLNQELANDRLKFIHYRTHHRSRDLRGQGGGVALLVRNDLESQPLDLALESTTEALIVSVTQAYQAKTVLVVTIYSPPNNTNFKSELFDKLAATRTDFIVLCVLNAKLASLCKQENHAGAVFDEILTKHGLVVLNDKTPTHYSFPNCTREYST